MILGGLELVLIGLGKALLAGAAGAAVGVAVAAVISVVIITVAAIIDAIDEWWNEDVVIVNPNTVDLDSRTMDWINQASGTHKRLVVNRGTKQAKLITSDHIDSDLRYEKIIDIQWS